MRAGPMDRYLELRHRVLTLNSSTGEQVESWPSAYASVWAEKVPKNSRRFFAAQQQNSEISELFRVRYRTDILSTDRIYLDGVAYRITPALEIGRRDGLEIPAIAVI